MKESSQWIAGNLCYVFVCGKSDYKLKNIDIWVDGLPQGPWTRIFALFALFGLFLVFIKTPNVSYTFKCFFEVPTRCWRVFQLFLVFVKYKRGLWQLPKGPEWAYLLDLGLFRPTLMLPIYPMHSNVSLRYLSGTDIYYNCFRVLLVTNGVCKGPSKGPKLSIFLFVQLFELFHDHFEVLHLSNELKCFPEQPIRYWHIFQLFLAPVRYIQAL